MSVSQTDSDALVIDEEASNYTAATAASNNEEIISSTLSDAAFSAHKAGYHVAVLAVKKNDKGNQYSFQYEGVVGKSCSLLENLFKEMVSVFGSDFQEYKDEPSAKKRHTEADKQSGSDNKITMTSSQLFTELSKLCREPTVPLVDTILAKSTGDSVSKSSPMSSLSSGTPSRTRERKRKPPSKILNVRSESFSPKIRRITETPRAEQSDDILRAVSADTSASHSLLETSISTDDSFPDAGPDRSLNEMPSFDTGDESIEPDTDYDSEPAATPATTDTDAAPDLFAPSASEFLAAAESPEKTPAKEKQPSSTTSNKKRRGRRSATAEEKAKRLQCPHCMVSLSSAQNVRLHIQSIHKKQKDHKCDHCGYATHSIYVLRRHVSSVHENNRPHKCDLCSMAFSRNYHLTRHKAMIHDDTKPHLCDQCGYTCTLLQQLKNHVRTHSQENKLKCTLCQFTTFYQRNLSEHVAQKHENIETTLTLKICPHCPFKTARGSNLQQHIDAVHNKIKAHACNMCQFATANRHTLKVHVEKTHKPRPAVYPAANWNAA